MIPDLGGVVEEATGRGLPDDLFQGGVLELGALDQVVQVVHIGLVVLAVVELQSLLGDVGRQGVHGIGQRR